MSCRFNAEYPGCSLFSLVESRMTKAQTKPVFADFGTSWTKILDTSTGSKKIIPAKRANFIKVDAATGRNAEKLASININELVALARGSARIAGVEKGSMLVLDIGARDMKYVHIKNGVVARMDWNGSCGALTGFTLELLGKHFYLDFRTIEPVPGEIPLTCGVLGMERIFDKIAGGENPSTAVAEFVRGLASLAYSFIDKPRSFHLSGGLCDNPLFLKSFPPGVEVNPLGRFVLLEGVAAEYESNQL